LDIPKPVVVVSNKNPITLELLLLPLGEGWDEGTSLIISSKYPHPDPLPEGEGKAYHRILILFSG
jgi:hypothetical protein